MRAAPIASVGLGGLLIAAALALSPADADPASLRIAGRVSRGGGPLAKASVEVRVVPPSTDPTTSAYTTADLRLLEAPDVTTPPAATAETGEDGSFVVSVPAGTTYEVRARGPDGTWAVPVDVGADGATSAAVALSVPPSGRTLRGKASYADGRPWRGRVVLSLRERGFGMSLYPSSDVEVPVDAEGRFHTDDVPVEVVSVSLVDPGRFRRIVGDVPCPSSEELVIVADAGLGPREVQVRAAGTEAPVARARVLVAGSVDGDVVLSASTTDESGTARVLAPARAGATAVAEGRARSSYGEFPTEGPLVLRLASLRTLTGTTVRADDGTPVGGVSVLAISLARDVPSDPRPPTKTTADATGRFSFPGLAPEGFVVVAHGSGWISANLLGTTRRAATAGSTRGRARPPSP